MAIILTPFALVMFDSTSLADFFFSNQNLKCSKQKLKVCHDFVELWSVLMRMHMNRIIWNGANLKQVMEPLKNHKADCCVLI